MTALGPIGHGRGRSKPLRVADGEPGDECQAVSAYWESSSTPLLRIQSGRTDSGIPSNDPAADWVVEVGPTYLGLSASEFRKNRGDFRIVMD